ncbi:hypothetical protein FB451DRAFT_1195351 [Mycena latifolia]|nr:hypothetical protein FB451DRAFT_1195351 [Mycena latifolia]
MLLGGVKPLAFPPQQQLAEFSPGASFLAPRRLVSLSLMLNRSRARARHAVSAMYFSQRCDRTLAPTQATRSSRVSVSSTPAALITYARHFSRSLAPRALHRPTRSAPRPENKARIRLNIKKTRRNTRMPLGAPSLP